MFSHFTAPRKKYTIQYYTLLYYILAWDYDRNQFILVDDVMRPGCKLLLKKKKLYCGLYTDKVGYYTQKLTKIAIATELQSMDYFNQ